MQATRYARPGVRYVIGPDKAPLSIADLPQPNTQQRWVCRRKAQIVAAVAGGLLTIDQACERYTLSRDEFLTWQRAAAQHGIAGLRTTKLQHYRSSDERPPSMG
jgi:hypothetical protein